MFTKWNSISGRIPGNGVFRASMCMKLNRIKWFLLIQNRLTYTRWTEITKLFEKRFVNYMTHFKLCPVSVIMAWIGLKSGSIKLWCSARDRAGRSIGDCSTPLWQTADPSSVFKVAQTSLSEGYQCDWSTHWKFALVVMNENRKHFVTR